MPLLSGCKSTYDQSLFQINGLTNIEIPKDPILVYNCNNEVFSGRVSRYSVFSFTKSPNTFLEEYNFNKMRDGELEKDYDKSFMFFLEFSTSNFQEEIPQGYLIDWDQEYNWIYHHELVFFIYSIKNLSLAVFIEGH